MHQMIKLHPLFVIPSRKVLVRIANGSTNIQYDMALASVPSMHIYHSNNYAIIIALK
jgi:hypothetical protein